MDDSKIGNFDQFARSESEASLLNEVTTFLRVNRKWWMLPIFFCLFAMGAILALSGSAVAPFIYTLF